MPRVTFLALISFACSLYISGTNGTLSKVLPIVWSDTKTTLKSGESQLILYFKFETPCEKFYDATLVPETKEYFTKWCNDEVVANVIRPLELLCRPASISGEKTRKKRLLGLLGLIPTIVSGVSSIVGLFSKPKPPGDPRVDGLIDRVGELSQDVQNIKNRIEMIVNEINVLHAKTDKNAQDIQILAARTKALEEGQAELKGYIQLLATALQELNQRMAVVEIDVDQIKKWKAELTATIGTTITLTSKLSSYFAVANSNLNEVTREWRENRFSLKLLDVFMVGTNSSLINIYRGATPVECHMDARGGLASFVFKKDNTDFGVHILRANPFTLYEMKPGSDIGFKLEYVGPRQVAYDSGADCIVPYVDGPADVLLLPQGKDCMIMNDKSVYKYWRKTCELMYYLDDNVIQVKALGDLYYIYCFGFDIIIYKAMHKCPNFVFPVHNRERIEIMNGKEVAKILRPTIFEITQDFHSSKVVYHLMPKIMELEFDKFPLSNSCPIISSETGKVLENVIYPKAELKTEECGVSMGFVIGGFVVLAVAILVIAIGLVFYIRRVANSNQRNPGGNPMPLMTKESGRGGAGLNIYEEINH